MTQTQLLCGFQKYKRKEKILTESLTNINGRLKITYNDEPRRNNDSCLFWTKNCYCVFFFAVYFLYACTFFANSLKSLFHISPPLSVIFNRAIIFVNVSAVYTKGLWSVITRHIAEHLLGLPHKRAEYVIDVQYSDFSGDIICINNEKFPNSKTRETQRKWWQNRTKSTLNWNMFV